MSQRPRLVVILLALCACAAPERAPDAQDPVTARCADFVVGRRVHHLDLLAPQPLPADVVAAGESRSEFRFASGDGHFALGHFGPGSDVGQLRVLRPEEGAPLIGLQPAWQLADAAGDWRQRLAALGVALGKVAALPAGVEGALHATSIPGLWVAAPPLPTGDGAGPFAGDAPCELWRASDLAALCAQLELVAWTEIEQRARAGDATWLGRFGPRMAMIRARPFVGAALVDDLLMAAVAGNEPTSPREDPPPRHEWLADRFLASCALLDEVGPGLHALTDVQRDALLRQASALAQELVRASAAARAAGLAAEARWLWWFAGHPGWIAALPSSLLRILPAAEVETLLAAVTACGTDDSAAPAEHAATTLDATLALAIVPRAPVEVVRAASRSHAERWLRHLVAAGQRAAESPTGAVAWTEWLASKVTQLERLRAHVDAAAFAAVLAAAVQPGPTAGEAASAEAFAAFGAALRACELPVFAAAAAQPAVRDALRVHAERLASACGSAADAAFAASLLDEAKWWRRLAADVARLVESPVAQQVSAGDGAAGRTGECASDVASVLQAVAARLASGCRGEGVAAAGLADLGTAGLGEAARRTPEFDHWRREFAAALAAQQRAVAARTRDEIGRAAAAGLRAHAAWRWHESAPDRAAPAPRTLLAAARDEQSSELATLLLPVIARLWPGVDPYDPDRQRAHAAAVAWFTGTPVARIAALTPGELADVVRFLQRFGGRPVVPMLHALDSQLRLDYRTSDRTFARDVAFTERNPELDGWEANAGALRDAVRLADEKLRRAVGVAPGDAQWNTWLATQAYVPGSVRELIELRAQAATSLWANRAFPPPATVPGRAVERFTVAELQQCFSGHASREVVVFADGISVAERVRHDLAERSYRRRPATPLSPAVDEWRDPEQVGGEVRTALDAATDAVLPRLFARLVAGRAARHLEEGRRQGWSDEQLRAEGAALQRWFDLPASDIAGLAAQVEGPRDANAVLDTQVGAGGWARRLFVSMPPVPPVEHLQEVASFAAVRSGDGSFPVRLAADLAHVVGRDEAGAAWAYDVVAGTRSTGATATALLAGSIDVEGAGDVVTWLTGPPDEHTFGVRWGPFWGSRGRELGDLRLEPLYHRDDRGGVHHSNQLMAFEVSVIGARGADGKQARRTIAKVPTTAPFHDAGLLLQGQLAWTLSQARTLRCGRESCDHRLAACWHWQGEPSIELRHVPSGDLVWRAADCRQLVVLAHLDRAITWHRDPAAPDDRRVVRVWALQPPK